MAALLGQSALQPTLAVHPSAPFLLRVLPPSAGSPGVCVLEELLLTGDGEGGGGSAAVSDLELRCGAVRHVQYFTPSLGITTAASAPVRGADGEVVLVGGATPLPEQPPSQQGRYAVVVTAANDLIVLHMPPGSGGGGMRVLRCLLPTHTSSLLAPSASMLSQHVGSSERQALLLDAFAALESKAAVDGGRGRLAGSPPPSAQLQQLRRGLPQESHRGLAERSGSSSAANATATGSSSSSSSFVASGSMVAEPPGGSGRDEPMAPASPEADQSTTAFVPVLPRPAVFSSGEAPLAVHPDLEPFAAPHAHPLLGVHLCGQLVFLAYAAAVTRVGDKGGGTAAAAASLGGTSAALVAVTPSHKLIALDLLHGSLLLPPSKTSCLPGASAADGTGAPASSPSSRALLITPLTRAAKQPIHVVQTHSRAPILLVVHRAGPLTPLLSTAATAGPAASKEATARVYLVTPHKRFMPYSVFAVHHLHLLTSSTARGAVSSGGASSSAQPGFDDGATVLDMCFLPTLVTIAKKPATVAAAAVPATSSGAPPPSRQAPQHHITVANLRIATLLVRGLYLHDISIPGTPIALFSSRSPGAYPYTGIGLPTPWEVWHACGSGVENHQHSVYCTSNGAGGGDTPQQQQQQQQCFVVSLTWADPLSHQTKLLMPKAAVLAADGGGGGGPSGVVTRVVSAATLLQPAWSAALLPGGVPSTAAPRRCAMRVLPSLASAMAVATPKLLLSRGRLLVPAVAVALATRSLQQPMAASSSSALLLASSVVFGRLVSPSPVASASLASPPLLGTVLMADSLTIDNSALRLTLVATNTEIFVADTHSPSASIGSSCTRIPIPSTVEFGCILHGTPVRLRSVAQVSVLPPRSSASPLAGPSSAASAATHLTNLLATMAHGYAAESVALLVYYEAVTSLAHRRGGRALGSSVAVPLLSGATKWQCRAVLVPVPALEPLAVLLHDPALLRSLGSGSSSGGAHNTSRGAAAAAAATANNAESEPVNFDTLDGLFAPAAASSAPSSVLPRSRSAKEYVQKHFAARMQLATTTHPRASAGLSASRRQGDATAANSRAGGDDVGSAEAEALRLTLLDALLDANNRALWTLQSCASATGIDADDDDDGVGSATGRASSRNFMASAATPDATTLLFHTPFASIPLFGMNSSGTPSGVRRASSLVGPSNSSSSTSGPTTTTAPAVLPCGARVHFKPAAYSNPTRVFACPSRTARSPGGAAAPIALLFVFYSSDADREDGATVVSPNDRRSGASARGLRIGFGEVHGESSIAPGTSQPVQRHFVQIQSVAALPAASEDAACAPAQACCRDDDIACDAVYLPDLDVTRVAAVVRGVPFLVEFCHRKPAGTTVSRGAVSPMLLAPSSSSSSSLSTQGPLRFVRSCVWLDAHTLVSERDGFSATHSVPCRDVLLTSPPPPVLAPVIDGTLSLCANPHQSQQNVASRTTGQETPAVQWYTALLAAVPAGCRIAALTSRAVAVVSTSSDLLPAWEAHQAAAQRSATAMAAVELASAHADPHSTSGSSASSTPQQAVLALLRAKFLRAQEHQAKLARERGQHACLGGATGAAMSWAAELHALQVDVWTRREAADVAAAAASTADTPLPYLVEEVVAGPEAFAGPTAHGCQRPHNDGGVEPAGEQRAEGIAPLPYLLRAVLADAAAPSTATLLAGVLSAEQLQVALAYLTRAAPPKAGALSLAALVPDEGEILAEATTAAQWLAVVCCWVYDECRPFLQSADRGNLQASAALPSSARMDLPRCAALLAAHCVALRPQLLPLFPPASSSAALSAASLPLLLFGSTGTSSLLQWVAAFEPFLRPLLVMSPSSATAPNTNAARSLVAFAAALQAASGLPLPSPPLLLAAWGHASLDAAAASMAAMVAGAAPYVFTPPALLQPHGSAPSAGTSASPSSVASGSGRNPPPVAGGARPSGSFATSIAAPSGGSPQHAPSPPPPTSTTPIAGDGDGSPNSTGDTSPPPASSAKEQDALRNAFLDTLRNEVAALSSDEEDEGGTDGTRRKRKATSAAQQLRMAGIVFRPVAAAPRANSSHPAATARPGLSLQPPSVAPPHQLLAFAPPPQLASAAASPLSFPTRIAPLGSATFPPTDPSLGAHRPEMSQSEPSQRSTPPPPAAAAQSAEFATLFHSLEATSAVTINAAAAAAAVADRRRHGEMEMAAASSRDADAVCIGSASDDDDGPAAADRRRRTAGTVPAGKPAAVDLFGSATPSPLVAAGSSAAFAGTSMFSAPSSFVGVLPTAAASRRQRVGELQRDVAATSSPESTTTAHVGGTPSSSAPVTLSRRAKVELYEHALTAIGHRNFATAANVLATILRSYPPIGPDPTAADTLHAEHQQDDDRGSDVAFGYWDVCHRCLAAKLLHTHVFPHHASGGGSSSSSASAGAAGRIASLDAALRVAQIFHLRVGMVEIASAAEALAAFAVQRRLRRSAAAALAMLQFAIGGGSHADDTGVTDAPAQLLFKLETAIAQLQASSSHRPGVDDAAAEENDDNMLLRSVETAGTVNVAELSVAPPATTD